MRVSITMTLIKTQNAMRRDSRDAGKRNSSFTAITSSPESFGGSQSKLKISGHQQRWPGPLPGAILIPPALLVVADFLFPKIRIICARFQAICRLDNYNCHFLTTRFQIKSDRGLSFFKDRAFKRWRRWRSNCANM
jgi:hypothetical protein